MAKRKTGKQIGAILSICMMLLLFTVPAAAQDSADYKVNDLSVKKGDTVTYTLYIKDLDQTVAGINVSVKYDQAHLALEEDTVNLPVFKDAVCNYSIEDEILFNAANAGTGYDIPEDGMIFSASFKVQGDPASVTITSEVLELYDMDLVQMAESDGYTLEDDVIEGTLPDVVAPQDVDARIEQARQQAAQDQSGEGSINVWILVAGAVAVLCIAAVAIIVMMRKNHAATQHAGAMDQEKNAGSLDMEPGNASESTVEQQADGQQREEFRQEAPGSAQQNDEESR
ncbi:MAG TPA: hypothetical protein IAD32_08190 [Candidatus Scatavimonas merdigallinarum]|uniref:Cohesin domain-containing protein n=1 Tax=Candidatus Scatavimonas merdigallinarum TaxID=2840914 RepID=A0A9D0ZIF2_9FIRM|nr:cohesin domain-containing protein [Acutalibacteraceae bacterium]HIQ81243.1 hypothetical protein [Candidatus Scatavimonas merdigallinarum]